MMNQHYLLCDALVYLVYLVYLVPISRFAWANLTNGFAEDKVKIDLNPPIVLG